MHIPARSAYYGLLILKLPFWKDVALDEPMEAVDMEKGGLLEKR